MAPDKTGYVVEIYNAWWSVRYYAPQRSRSNRLRRAQAIRKLGLAIREAFNSSDDFETLIAAVVDGSDRCERHPF